jgi:hypothetical protein
MKTYSPFMTALLRLAEWTAKSFICIPVLHTCNISEAGLLPFNPQKVFPF